MAGQEEGVPALNPLSTTTTTATITATTMTTRSHRPTTASSTFKLVEFQNRIFWKT